MCAIKYSCLFYWSDYRYNKINKVINTKSQTSSFSLYLLYFVCFNNIPFFSLLPLKGGYRIYIINLTYLSDVCFRFDISFEKTLGNQNVKNMYDTDPQLNKGGSGYKLGVIGLKREDIEFITTELSYFRFAIALQKTLKIDHSDKKSQFYDQLLGIGTDVS